MINNEELQEKILDIIPTDEELIKLKNDNQYMSIQIFISDDSFSINKLYGNNHIEEKDDNPGS